MERDLGHNFNSSVNEDSSTRFQIQDYVKSHYVAESFLKEEDSSKTKDVESIQNRALQL